MAGLTCVVTTTSYSWGMDVVSIYQKFPDQKVCLEHLEKIRWPNGPVCPYCSHNKVTRRKEGTRFLCNKCNRSFSVLVKTIFYHSKLDLQKWFLGIALILNAKKGISSWQLSRHLKINKDTAWYLQMRIRQAMKLDRKLLSGLIEIDETYIGGNLKNKSKRIRAQNNTTGMVHKTPVLGILERGGQVFVQVLSKAYGETIKPLVMENVCPSSSLITDGFGGYYGLKKYFKEHTIINHQNNEWVKGDFHTNTIEGFWGIVKRGIIGQYHKISLRYLQLYLDEFSYKYSRKDSLCFNSLLNNMLSP